MLADAGAPKERGRTLVAVGDGSPDVKLFPTFDGRVVVVAGSTPYEGKGNGVLEPLVTPAGLAALHPDDDTFVGFLEPSLDVLWVRGDLGPPGTLFLDGSMGKRKTFALRDGKLTATTKVVDARHVVRWRGKLLGAQSGTKMNDLEWLDDKSEAPPPALPKIPTITGLAVDAQGALVVLGFGPYEPPRAAIYPATWMPGTPPTIVEGVKSPSCSLVPSFDASVVLRCSDSTTGFGDGAKFFRVSTAGFERVFADAPEQVSAASIGKDGALYVTSPKRIAVERCPAPRGKCTPIAVKDDLGTPPTANYEPSVSDVLERKGDDIGDRSWTTIRIEAPSGKEPIVGSYSILARAEDDVWLLTRNPRRGYVLHSTDDRTRERVHLPSRLDGRFIAKNASPPQAWTGHCEQVFVRLAGSDADAIKQGVPEIEKALGAPPESYESAFHWWLVEGRLHESHAIGVVVVRRDVEEPLDKMERAIERLVTAFSPNPTSMPSAYCTLPVLERRLHPSAP